MQNTANCDRLHTDAEGWVTCPICRRNRRVLRVLPDTRAENLQVFCRTCKNEIIVNIENGECYKSRGLQ